MKNIISKILISLLLLGTFFFGLPMDAKSASSDIPNKQHKSYFVVETDSYVSPVFFNEFSFTGVSSAWPKGFEDIGLFLRFGEGQSDLGDWVEVEQERGKDVVSSSINGEIITTNNKKTFQYKIDFPSNHIGKDFEIIINVFDASDWSSGSSVRISSADSSFGPRIISRSEWGANSNYMTWAPEYGEVKAFVIHHTAGEEGANHPDQMSVVRNLYYGHAISYGWGDLGYNYVIDVNGNIYEGRSGGNSVIGGHVLGYNTDTVGISLIGDYNVRNVEQAQYDALISLIAYISYQNQVDPTGTVFLKNKTINTIVGHNELNATLCPGVTLHGRLSDIRNKAKEKTTTYPERTHSAQVLSSGSSHSIYGGDTKKISVDVKNAGNAYLLGKGAGKVSVVAIGGKASVVSTSFGPSIEASKTGKVDFDISVPMTNESILQNFELRANGQKINGSDFSLNLNITTPDYRAKIIKKSNSISLKSGEQATLWVDIENAGGKAWSSSDSIYLATNDGRNSVFYTEGDWPSRRSVGGLDNQNLNSKSTGRLSFMVTAPNSAGEYKEKFLLRSDNRSLVGDSKDIEVEWTIIVSQNEAQLTNSTVEQKVFSSELMDYNFEHVNQSAYLNLNPGETKSVSLQVKNIGSSNWYKDMFRLATINDKESPFANGSWLSKNRIAMNKEKVAPGETATFDFTVTAPSVPGLVKERFGLVVDGIGWMRDIGIFWNFTVLAQNNSSGGSPSTPSPSSSSDRDDFEYVSQSPYTTMASGETQQVWIEVKNTGTKAWQKSGNSPVRLATSNPRDRSSSFINTNRVFMDKETVNPGETVRFTFNVTAPSEARVYKEYFTLVRDGVAWMKDIGIFWQFTVTKAQDVSVSPSPSQSTGQLVSIPVGTETVKVSASGPFIVVNGAESKLAEGKNGDIVEAYYKDGKHYFRINNGSIQEASGWVRIVPWAVGTILTIDSYTDRPTWNQSLNDNKFKGALEVRYSAKNKKLWVINDLNIEDYLKGVSEPLDSAGYEYVKAAVIAERSYVYYHLERGGRWPDDFITLKNSRKGNGDDQIYQGYGFTLRGTNTVRAVEDTKGMVVTYNNKPVLTPYYTQSDGRTRSISEVWGSKQSDYPWLVSVSDPWSSGSQMLGHGVGMSGKGARGMATDGKKYDEILKYFYTGTSIGSIDTNRNVRIGIYFIEQ